MHSFETSFILCSYCVVVHSFHSLSFICANMKLSVDEVLDLGLAFVNYKPARKCSRHFLVEKFKTFYGPAPKVLRKIWNRLCSTSDNKACLDKKDKNEKGFRLFMCVNHFLFCYPKNGTVLSNAFGKSANSVYDKEFWGMLKKICRLSKEKIVWPEEEFAKDDGAKIPFSLDGVDCKIQEPKHPTYNLDKDYSSHKFGKKAGLRYELAIALHSSDLVWISGPHKAGKYTDLKIFRKKLKGLVEKLGGKKGMADGGFEGEEDLLCLPSSLDKTHERKYKSRARCRHETFNGRIKKYQSMDGKWKQGKKKHKLAFVAICVILQYEMENGSPLFNM